MIQLKDLSLGYKDKVLIKDADTIFPSGQLTALIGRNGSGKSTLMKAVCGLNADYSGQILLEGEDIRQMKPQRLAKLLAYVNTQRPRMANLKCKDIVALGRTPHTAWHGRLASKDLEITDEALEMVDMIHFKNREFNSLSDGESQKIMIARAIAQDSPIILLDEPTSFLDLPTRHEIVALMKYLCHEKGKTILYSTHELDIALNKSDNVALIEEQCLINLPAEEMKLCPMLKPFIF